jgi:hypothetical protein
LNPYFSKKNIQHFPISLVLQLGRLTAGRPTRPCVGVGGMRAGRGGGGKGVDRPEGMPGGQRDRARGSTMRGPAVEVERGAPTARGMS